MAEVIIVGAGPTGMTLAYLLARRGIAVTLVEAAANFERVFRGEGLMPGGLYALEQMELLQDVLRLPHQQIHCWQFVVDGQPILKVQETEALGVYRPTVISQPAFLQQVLAQIQAYPHFRFIQGAVQSLRHDGRRVTGVVVRQAGHSISLDATLVIGADGRGSTVRRLANLPLQKLDYDTNVLWLRLPVPLPEWQRVAFYGFIRGSESLGAYTAWDGSLKFAYLLPSHPKADQPLDWKSLDWAARVAQISSPDIAQHVRAHANQLEPPVLLNVVFGRCLRWWQPGILLLGDAAHPMAPIRAQGINLALRDSIVAANHLLPLLQSEATSERLDAALATIQSEREPEICRCQSLQRAEQAQANAIARSLALRRLLTLTAPVLHPLIAKRWLARQKHLRFGLQPIQLMV